MSQTNIKQCHDTSRGVQSHRGSRGTHCSNHNDNCRNSTFANSSFLKKLTKNHISHLSITKGGPWSIQLKKILEVLPKFCQDTHYDYTSDIISINTKPTQEYFLSNYPIKERRSSKHHMKMGFVTPIIGLDVTSGNSSVDYKMIENTPIFNWNPKNNTVLIMTRNWTQNPRNGINLLPTKCPQ